MHLKFYRTGVYMSELLYMFGQIDDRVMPLIFTIRRWAQSVGLTNPSPGRWISNFSLTCLVIFYLQQIKQPILPAINTLMLQARRPNDIRITDDSVNCTFLRDINQLAFTTDNKEPLDRLLLDFFEFYSQMDFHEYAISLIEGRAVAKLDHSPIYIVNPLEPQLNVSKNISLEECERFRVEVRNAAWALDSFSSHETSDDWGILCLFKTIHKAQVIRPNMFFKQRMVDVSELFENTTQDQQLPSVRAGKDYAPPIKVDYKNDMVRKVIEKIQRKGRSDIQQIDNKESLISSASTIPSRAKKR